MRFIPAKYERRLSSKLLLANVATSVALLLIAGFIVYSFTAVRIKSADVAFTDIDNVIQNSRATRRLSKVFSDIELLDRTFYAIAEYPSSEGRRLAKEIENIRESTINEVLKESLSTLSKQFNFFLSQGAIVNEVLRSRELIDEEIHAELTKLEALISEWLIEATLQEEDTEFVTQQLILVNGYRESLLIIARLYAELNLSTGFDSFSIKNSPIIEAIDDLALRLQTITASIPEVAQRGEIIKDILLEYRAAVERVYKDNTRLNWLRENLNVSKESSLSAMEVIEIKLSTAAQSRSERLRK